jgi:antitoxin (DNA-binding transcriptional repressor) of toxin-antitoxin stability system
MTITTVHKKQLTSREFFRSPAKVATLVGRGEHIVVTNRGRAVFEVVPKQVRKGKTIADFVDLQFSDLALDPDLSKRIDEIAYGS